MCAESCPGGLDSVLLVRSPDSRAVLHTAQGHMDWGQGRGVDRPYKNRNPLTWVLVALTVCYSYEARTLEPCCTPPKDRVIVVQTRGPQIRECKLKSNLFLSGNFVPVGHFFLAKPSNFLKRRVTNLPIFP